MPVPAVQGGKDTDCPEVISVTFDLQMLCAPLLPSHPYSLLLFFSQVTSPHSFAPSLRTPICYCKPPPLLLFFHKHVLQPLTPHTSPPPFSWELLQPWSSSFVESLTPQPHAQLPWEPSVFTYVVSSSCCQSAAPPAVLLLPAPMATSNTGPPPAFSALPTCLLQIERNPGTSSIYQKSTWMEHHKEEKSMFRRKAHRCIMALLISQN